MRGCNEKKSFRVGSSSLASWIDLSSSGESDFFNCYLQVCGEKIFVVKRDMAYDAKSVCDNAKINDVTEKSVDVELFDLRSGRSGGWHGAVGSFIGSIILVKTIGFCIGFQLSDDTVGIFGIIFPDKSIDSGGIKDGHVRFDRINGLTNWFRKINKAQEDLIQIHQKILFKTGDLGSIRHFIEAAEFTQMAGIVKKDGEQGVGRDGKNPLDDESLEEGI